MRFLRKGLKGMVPYHANYIKEGILLNANESPYEVPEALVDYMKEQIGELLINRYPDTDSLELRQEIAKLHKVNLENIVCGVGSDELIDCILSSSLEGGDQVLVPDPSFSMYTQFTMLNNGELIKVPLKEDFTYDLKVLLQIIDECQPKVIFICNPNNPTGCILRPDEVELILQTARGIVVVDEAYEDFCEASVSVIPLIKAYRNLIVLKTFSKAYGLAGARVGYGIATTEMIELINTVKAPYNLNLFSQSVATWVISHRELFKENINQIVKERTRLYKALKSIGLRVYPSYANFLWVEMEDALFNYLQQQKIYIRKMYVQQKNYYRITVGKTEENNSLLQAIIQYQAV